MGFTSQDDLITQLTVNGKGDTVVTQECRRTTTGNLESYGACTELASIIHQSGAPRIYDGAVIGLLASGYAGSLASSFLSGALEVIWN